MKVAVITGASQGIGNAIAKKFSENGYRVFNLSRTPAEGIESIKTDVSDRENVFDSIGEVVKRAGRIDVLVNNAGFGISGAVEDTDESAVHAVRDAGGYPRYARKRRRHDNQYVQRGRAFVAAFSVVLFLHEIGGVVAFRGASYRT